MAITFKICPKCGTEPIEGCVNCPTYHGRTGGGFCPMYVDGESFESYRTGQFNVITVEQHELMRKGAMLDYVIKRHNRVVLCSYIASGILIAVALWGWLR